MASDLIGIKPTLIGMTSILIGIITHLIGFAHFIPTKKEAFASF